MTGIGAFQPIMAGVVIGRSCPKPDLAEIRNSGTTGHMPALDQLVCASLQVSIPPEQIASVTVAR
jgi:hypothetical protein